jgi:hypothetical protein
MITDIWRADEHERPTIYEIRVKGALDDRWLKSFDGVTLSSNDTSGQTTLSGPVADQAAPHGILHKGRDLGLPLLSVRRWDPERPGVDPTAPQYGAGGRDNAHDQRAQDGSRRKSAFLPLSLRYVTASLVLRSRELVTTALCPGLSSNNAERSGKQDGYS